MRRINTLFEAKHDERGVVSIFIVIFAAIFMTIITVSFLSLMVHDQQQATNNELSQNAYDSAMSGVEDAKRAIAGCKNGTISEASCQKLGSGACTTLSDVGVVHAPQTMTDGSGNREYPLQGSEGDTNSLNQAYTCVTVDTTPSDYKADLTKDNPTVIPLTAQSAGSSSLTLSWQAIPSRTFTNGGSAGNLLNLNAWTSAPNSYPPMMRVQFIKGASNSTASSNSRSLFLYPQVPPSEPSETSSVSFALDSHTTNTSWGVFCWQKTCSAKLTDGSNNLFGSNNYLVITPLYENASATLAISGGGKFSNVQDVVDSTGRANDLFRRVQARVDLIPHPTYPNGELNLTGPLCKNFVVTPNSYIPGYDSSTTCK